MTTALPNHDGSERHPVDRFGPVPHTIGELVSASTSDGRAPRGLPAGNRPLRLLIGFALGWIAVAACNALITGWGSDYHPASFGPGLLVLGLFWLGTGPRHRASFVGTLGFATSTKLFGLFWSRPEVQSLQSATGLGRRFVRLYTGQAYRVTRFTFEWTDEQGRPVARLAGRFEEADISTEAVDARAVERLPPYDSLHLALAAERVWRARTGASDPPLPLRISEPEASGSPARVL